MNARSFILLTLGLLLFYFGAPSVASAQKRSSDPSPEIQIENHPSCDSCRIQLQSVLLLGSPSDSVSPTIRSSVVRTREGEYWVEPSFDPGQMLVYGPRGEHIRSVGRLGEGPGEFSGYPQKTIQEDPDGKLLVFDPGNARMTTLSPDGQVRATRPIPPASSYLAVKGGAVVFSGGVSSWQDRQTAGEPLHTVKENGERASFGNPENLPVVRGAGEWVRNISPGPDGQFWATHVFRYTMELWTLDGHLVRTVTGSPDWFPPDGERGKIGRDPPVPMLGQTLQTENGYLISLCYVPDRDWRTGPERDESGHLSLRTATSINAYWDTVIQVLDPVSGRLLASTRVDPHLRGFADPDHLFSFVEDDLGNVFVEVWRVEVTLAQ